MEDNWKSAGKELPEETTVLVYLSDGFVGLGIYLEGKWEVNIAPWDSAPREYREVLYWRYLPWPSFEDLEKLEADSAAKA